MAQADIDTSRLPKHIAIIMDGNGRWAKKNGVRREAGHEAGVRSVRAVIEAGRELGIDVLSLYAFSTENWNRSKREVTALFLILGRAIRRELDELHRQNIRITIMGRMEGLSKKVRADLEHCQELTKNNSAMIVNVGINYGGRAEIADAAKAIAETVRAGNLAVEDIDEACFARHLYRPELPDPDMLIRTSGEMRLSNFMLWELSYAEIIATKTLWPEFRKRHLVKAIEQYQARSRRYGGR